MAIICETSAIFNCSYAAIIPIEITACDDTCFQKKKKYKEQTILTIILELSREKKTDTK